MLLLSGSRIRFSEPPGSGKLDSKGFQARPEGGRQGLEDLEGIYPVVRTVRNDAHTST